MPLFKERNDEMDLAYYYEPGSYDSMLREAFQESFDDDMVLYDIDIRSTSTVVSPSKNLLQLGSVIGFHNDDDELYSYYDMVFRKNGDDWVISR